MDVDTDERELRIALVMTGGVSLAVWIGGVAAEVYRLVRRSDAYRALCELTGTRVVVDVITGSSAGGLNGALLGTALSYGVEPVEFDKLRNLWFSAGSFTELLRNPKDKNPPSVLRGDDYFTPQIRGVIERWIDGATPLEPDDNPLTVVLTASLLSPEVVKNADVFGTVIDEPVHRARFRFGANEFYERDQLPARLALAARTSASFPGAFEPSFIPIGRTDASAHRPDMTGIANFTRSRWAVDGGVLMNKPVEPALDLINERHAGGDVRRVLAYVNPDPGTRVPAVDLEEDMPALSSVVLSSLVTLPRAESIARDLAEISDYNRRNRIRRETRDRLTWGSLTTSLGTLPDAPADARRRLARTGDEVYPLWVRRRVARAVLSRLEAHLARVGGDLEGVAAKTEVRYRDLLVALEEQRLGTGWLPEEPPTAAELSRLEIWRYGFSPIEYVAGLALDLVRRTYALQLPASGAAPAATVRSALGQIRSAVHDERRWLRALRGIDDDYYAYWLDHLTDLGVAFCANDLAAAIHERWPTPPADLTPPFDKTWVPAAPDDAGHGPQPVMSKAAALAIRTRRLRVWRRVQRLLEGDDVLAAEVRAQHEREDDAKVDATSTIDPLLGFPTNQALQFAMRRAELRIARRLAVLLQELRPLVDIVVNDYVNVRTNPRQLAVQGQCAPVPAMWEPEALRQTMSVLMVGVTVDDILVGATRLFFVHSSVDDGTTGSDARIDFAQISANARNELDPKRADPQDKVAGLQLGHFGGFVKESWRANDWMWGALDGASILVRLVLDPVRLRQRFDSADMAVAAIREFATVSQVEGLPTAEREWLRNEWETKYQLGVRTELAFLDPGPDQPLPTLLPATWSAVTRVVQLFIGARELPEVRASIKASTRSGADENANAAAFLEHMDDLAVPGQRYRVPISEVPVLVERCRIGSERVSDELGSDAGAAVATKAAAVMATAAAGSRSGLGPLRHGAGGIRVALLTVYYTALSAARRSKIGFALVTLLLAVGAGAIAARLLGGDVPDAVLVVAIAALGFWVLLTGMTAGSYGYAIGGALLLGVIALSFIPQEAVCTTFADTCTGGDQPGWKGTVRWLVPISLALLAVVFAIVAHRINSKRAAVDERLGQTTPRRRKVLTYGPAIVFAVAAGAYVIGLHNWLFTGDGTSGSRGWAVDQLEGWSSANVVVILVGLPLLFILLGYFRQTYRDGKSKRARKRAAERARSPEQATRQLA